MVIKQHYKLSNDLKKRIVLISDIHYYCKDIIPNLYNLLKEIKATNPDFICITGDLVDDMNITSSNYLVKWLKSLSNIADVLISMGNHEQYYNHELKPDYDKKLFKKINEIDNVYVLDNETYKINNINFIGINLPYSYYHSGEKIVEFISFMNQKYPKLDKGYNILLCHSPYVIARRKVLDKLKCKNDINLVLSGHMHAGLTFEWLKKIFKGRGFITPQKGIFRKYCYGKYTHDNIDIIISSGVTKLSKSHKFGIFNRFYKEEIVIIDI